MSPVDAIIGLLIALAVFQALHIRRLERRVLLAHMLERIDG